MVYGKRPEHGITSWTRVSFHLVLRGVHLNMQCIRRSIMASLVLLVGVYVDDLIITCSIVGDIVELKDQMNKHFSMSDLGQHSYYLGIEVKQSAHGVSLCQAGYAAKILEQSGMKGCNPWQTPMENRLKLSKKSEDLAEDATMYQSIVGSLRYLVNTRLDINFLCRRDCKQVDEVPHNSTLGCC